MQTVQIDRSLWAVDPHELPNSEKTVKVDKSMWPISTSTPAQAAVTSGGGQVGGNTGNGWVDGLLGLVQLYYADRQAERQAPAQFAQYQLDAVQGYDQSMTQNPNAPGAGLHGRAFTIGGVSVSNGTALMGLALLGLAAVLVLK